MLHTLNSVSLGNTIELTNHQYNIFDSRTFRSNMDMEVTFANIANSFIRIWNTNIKLFIDYIYNDDGFYNKPTRPVYTTPVYTTEEAIYARLQGFSLENIRGYYISKYIRIFAIPDMNTSNFCVLESLVYSIIDQSNNKVLTIFMDEGMLRNKDIKDNPNILNVVLFKILHICATGYMDYRLSTDYNVPLNRTWCKLEGANKDSIILPEQLSLTDSRFIFHYYYTLFYIINAVTNTSIIKNFNDYINLIELPSLFMPRNCNDDSTEEDFAADIIRIYNNIWKLADDSVNTQENCITDAKYIDICTDIMLSIQLNIDDAYYEAEEYDIAMEEDE